jgi:hypothetical protein
MDGRNLGEQVEAQFKEQGAGRYRHVGIKLKRSPGGFREIHSRPSFPVNGDKFKKGFVHKQPPLSLPYSRKARYASQWRAILPNTNAPLKISTRATWLTIESDE